MGRGDVVTAWRRGEGGGKRSGHVMIKNRWGDTASAATAGERGAPGGSSSKEALDNSQHSRAAQVRQEDWITTWYMVRWA